MMQQYRAKYPESWEAMARACKERAGWKCEACGAAQHTIAISKRGTPYIIYLAACHVNHDQDNLQPELKALCVACHGRHDYQQRQRAARVHLEHMKHLRRLIDIGEVEVTAYL
jgi:hypothetical protein